MEIRRKKQLKEKELREGSVYESFTPPLTEEISEENTEEQMDYHDYVEREETSEVVASEPEPVVEEYKEPAPVVENKTSKAAKKAIRKGARFK